MSWTKHVLLVVALLLIGVGGVAADAEPAAEPGTVLAFYYPWHGNPQVDGEYRHWNHEVMGGEGGFPGGEDIGANFYPELGCYSNNDPAVVATHMRQMRDAGIDVVVTSWWGPGSFEDQALPLLLNAAQEHGLGVAIHLEPYYGSIAEVRAALVYLDEQYGQHAAYFSDSTTGLPLVFAYDSYRLPWTDWAALLSPAGDLSIRGTEFDALVTGLWIRPDGGELLEVHGFDGAYTYFAIDGFSYGSTPSNWPAMADWAAEQGRLFIPCVAPGYCDARIRPWNAGNTCSREGGAYYDRQWQAALAIAPVYVGITSFNEWHEGTQLEPAIPLAIDGFTYLDYEPLAPDYYLERTAHWAQGYRLIRAGELSREEFANAIEPERRNHLARTCQVELLSGAAEAYPAGERGEKLTDGLLGGLNCRDGRWVGFEAKACQLQVWLAESCLISTVRLRFLSDPGSWVFPPTELVCSLDGMLEPGALTAAQVAWNSETDAQVIEYVFTCTEPQFASEVGVTALHSGVCPPWHGGAGGAAWLFLDEVIIE